MASLLRSDVPGARLTCDWSAPKNTHYLRVWDPDDRYALMRVYERDVIRRRITELLEHHEAELQKAQK